MRFISLLTIGLFTTVATQTMAAPVPIDSSVFDRDAISDTKYGIGITFSVAQRPFEGVDNQLTSLPYLSFRYKDLYVEGTDVGFKLVAKEKYSLDIVVTPRYYETQPSFANNGELDGIDKTKQTFFAGLSSQYRSDFAIYTVQLLKDIKESDGTELVATISKSFKVSKSLSLSPALGFTWQDSNLVDHFYGVQANEVIANRPLYKAQSSLNYYASLTTVWSMTKQVQLLAQLKYEVLGSGITRSPIVNETAITSYVLGTVYRF